jgi:microcystin-dependent protein
MPYIVTFTEKDQKVPITVYDNTSNTDTSLTLPGRNVTGYGQIIAENFVRLLENFAGPGRPVNPVEGQLWYDTTNEQLKIWDSVDWKAASNIQTSVAEPAVGASRKGDLWVNTSKQQLSIFSGSKWILVGPYISTIDGKRTGPIVETIIDQDNTEKTVVTFYVDDSPLVIISKDRFFPKSDIFGFTVDGIKPGINITTETFLTGFPTRLLGIASSAENLRINDANVASSKFLRSDTINTTDFQFNVRNNLGITVGADSTLNILNGTNGAKIYNSLPGAVVDIQTSKLDLPSTVLRVKNDRVGINSLDPQESLDVTGNALLTGTFYIKSESDAVNVNSGALQVTGGASIKKKLVVGGNIDSQGIMTTRNIVPPATDTYSIGGSITNRYKEIYAKTITAQEFNGSFTGNINGNADTANALKNPTTFRFKGAVTLRNDVSFDGSGTSTVKEFDTVLSVDLIQSQDLITRSTYDTNILIYLPRSSASNKLGRITRDNFVGELAVPVGTILPFAGTTVPAGYLLCDGSEILKNRYADLFDIIANNYVPIGYTWRSGSDFNLYFKLPDFRGRFPLGADNMANGLQISSNSQSAGGGTANVVTGAAAATVGGTSGSQSYTLAITNLPQHEHNMQGTRADGVTPGDQYYAVNATNASPTDVGSSSRPGGLPVAGQLASLPSSGKIKDQSSATLSQPFSIMNPYQTINYIIRYGRDFFDPINS